ncbi:phage tail protein, partial [Mycobacterium tuberculosis]
MALKEYVGSISLEVDGVEVEVATVSPKTNTGRRPVKTMNRLRNIAGFSRGIKTYDLRVTAVIPIEGSPLD